MTEILTVNSLVKQYGGSRLGSRGQSLLAVDDVSFSVSSGDTLGLLGESGAGKSTIGRCLLGLEEPTSGVVRLFGRDIVGMSQKEWRQVRLSIQAVFQDPKSSMNPRWTVGQVIADPLRRLTSKSNSAINERVRELLRLVGLSAELEPRYRHQLSGGQQQRVCIARALAVEPSVILLDEPVSALDASVKRDIVHLLRSLQEATGIAFILISHDLRVAAALCSNLIILRDGRIVETGPADLVLERALHPYTRELLQAELAVPGDSLAIGSRGWSEPPAVSWEASGELIEVSANHLVAGEIGVAND